MMKSTKRNLLIKVSPFIVIAILYIVTATAETTTYQDEFNQLRTTIEEQSQKIQILEEKIDGITPETIAFSSNKNEKTAVNIDDFSNPEYDSGWIPIEPGSTCTLTHDQGVHIFVYVLGWDSTDDGGYVVHQNFVGDGHWDIPDGDSCGIRWYCSNDNKITLYRGVDDCFWDEFRVYIWKIEES